MDVGETKKRTLVKTISWRVIAVVNSFLILAINVTDNNLINALCMNVTGFGIYYFFDRVWSRVNYGRVVEQKWSRDKIDEDAKVKNQRDYIKNMINK